ncbi:MAG: amidohydrolase family protein, partial [Mycoplasmataceae bacterium]|nr:amidohydrolase family protein [Mycoplasmataceae bacterium]
MATILIKNVNLISVSSIREKIEMNVDILIKGGKINKIGKNLKIKADQIINATNKWIIPGMINCHCHIPMSLFREIVDGYKLQEWLTKAIWPIEGKMTDEDIYYFSLLSMIESIENGVTTINDMYFKTEHIIKAVNKSSINAVLGMTLMDVDGEVAGNARIDNFNKLLKDFPKQNVSTLIHGLYTNSPKYLQKALAFGKKNNKMLCHMHFCENTDEVKTICKNYNVKHPGQVLEQYFKGFKLVLAHCVKIDDYTMSVLKKMNASVVHNPISNLRLGCGFADLKTM